MAILGQPSGTFRMNIILNFLIYQVAWFLCVFKENTGALIALPLLCLHFYFSQCKKADLMLMAIVLVAGLIIDGTLHFVGCMTFNVPALPIPFWLATVWIFLATLPNHSLIWLKGRPVLSGIFGAIGGPLAYWAGIRVGAANFGWNQIEALSVIALIWSILWPVVMYLANRILPK